MESGLARNGIVDITNQKFQAITSSEKISPIRTAALREELSPASSPEIIVDELTPEQQNNEKDRQTKPDKVSEQTPESLVTAAAALKQQLSPPTPMRPAVVPGSGAQRGPKKNFLARQAALDAKLNVLRIRATQAEKGGKGDDDEEDESVKLEMSDDDDFEVIQNNQ